MGHVKTMSKVKTNSADERLKAALKENLKRRKAQARGRQAAKTVDVDSPCEDEAKSDGH
jgi:hypothetical protein